MDMVDLTHLLILVDVEVTLTDKGKARLIEKEEIQIVARAVKVIVRTILVPPGRKKWCLVRIPEERVHYKVQLLEHKAGGVAERVQRYHDKNQKI